MGGGLYMRSRDMLKLGQLVLQNGTWNNEQIVSQNWIEDMTTPSNAVIYYGYYWWLRDFSYKSNWIHSKNAEGAGGQYIAVFPDLEMVVVLTGGHYNSVSIYHPVNIITNYILKSVN
jgi:CubicO group peptidase (beta-lactamase class C family)